MSWCTKWSYFLFLILVLIKSIWWSHSCVKLWQLHFRCFSSKVSLTLSPCSKTWGSCTVLTYCSMIHGVIASLSLDWSHIGICGSSVGWADAVEEVRVPAKSVSIFTDHILVLQFLIIVFGPVVVAVWWLSFLQLV